MVVAPLVASSRESHGGSKPGNSPLAGLTGRGEIRASAQPVPVRELPVKKDEMEFEIEFARDGRDAGLDKFHVHIRCFAAREFERRSENPDGPS